MKLLKNPLFIIGILLLILLFFWFQVRPAIIKHNCSWVKMHTDAISAKAVITEEQLKEKGLIKTCPSPTPRPSRITGPMIDFTGLFDNCATSNQNVIDANKPQEYVPAKDWYTEASTQEYTFCLHSNGL